MKKTLLILTALVAPSIAFAQQTSTDAPIATDRTARLLRPSTPVVLQAQPAPGVQTAMAAPPPQQALPAGQGANAVPKLQPANAPVTANTPPAVQTRLVPSAPLHAPPPIAAPAQRVRLTPRETQSVAISNAWQQNKSMPAPGDEGSVVFGFGTTLPTIVCAPLFVCDLQLQAGEIVNDINLGDSVRWKISPAASGAGANQVTHVLIKPTDSGLTTNLVITTDRRDYVVKLVIEPKTWMARVSFSYPDEQRAQWENFIAAQRAQQAVAQATQLATRTATVLPSGETIDRLDFGFDLSGDKPSWRPLRVYSDGRKTYIEFPREMRDGEAPALVGVGPGNAAEVINYRAKGNRYVVDQVVDRVALISGVGRHQVRVDIRRSVTG